MALIGPRLERPAFCAEFEKRIHGWNYRALVKPGLSGLAQVKGGYDLLPKEKVALDLWRVGYPSLRIARVTDPPHSSTISTALRLCSSVQLGIRELWTGQGFLDGKISFFMDWSRFLGRKNKLLQATSRSRSHGAL